MQCLFCSPKSSSHDEDDCDEPNFGGTASITNAETKPLTINLCDTDNDADTSEYDRAKQCEDGKTVHNNDVEVDDDRKNDGDGLEALRPVHFFKTYFTGPWVLVENGSLKGFFDFVPAHFRVGSWHPLSGFSLLLVVFILYESNPEWTILGDLDEMQSVVLTSAFTLQWYSAVICFGWMAWIMYLSSSSAGPVILITFTILSWTMNMCRFFLLAISPFVKDPANNTFAYFVTQALYISRCPCLLTASLVFVIWNFVLMPIIALKFMKSVEARTKFLKWCFNFRLTNVHIINLPLSIIGAIYVPGNKNAFTELDLFYTYAYGISYLFFYLFVLDRIGVHLYPILSPRSILGVFMWPISFFLNYLLFTLYNNKVLIDANFE